MLAVVQLSTTTKSLDAISRDDWNNLHQEMPVFFSRWDEREEKHPQYYYWQESVIDLSTDGALLARHGIDFVVKRFKGAYKYEVGPRPDGSVVNIQIAIPAIGLLAMDEVMNLDDACTDELQLRLKEGWRIIAVCPPDAQRRPDYILGRSPAMARDR